MTTRPTSPASRRLACAETATGSGVAAVLLQLPGMTAWVNSSPAGRERTGGDVHYLSLCPDCLVSRIALADVSGHGSAVASVAMTLRSLMQRHLRTLSQVGLMRDLNDAVRTELDEAHYATMVAAGWHHRRGLLVVTNAGHPPPLCYRAASRQWSWVEGRAPIRGEPRNGIPLGLLADISYSRLVLKPDAGDMLVLYSDGASEAVSPAGDELGRDRLMAIAGELDVTSADEFGEQFIAAVDSFRGSSESTDDQTVIALRRNDA